MLHLGSVLLKQLYNLDLKFKKNWPKKGSAEILFKKILTQWCIKVTG